MPDIIKIESFKYPYTPRYFYPSLLVEDTPEYLTLFTPIGSSIWSYLHKNTIPGQGNFLSVLFPERDYNVSIAFNPDWHIDHYYINVALPPERAENIVRYIDIDLDVRWLSEHSHDVINGELEAGVFVLDRDEFEEHKIMYNYPSEIIERAELALEQILRHIESRVFPFGDTYMNWRPPFEVPELGSSLDWQGIWQD
jgi:predicted RNA-binding protein associated with RNAse of E/G family